MDSDGRSGGRTPGTDEDTLHYPKVVLVTGACRFLGGYLTARLAQNPLINHVIAVDAIAPSKDLLRRMGRAEFVRADIRNPFIAKVIRNGDVDTVVHAAAASYAPRSGGKAALKELNVMGAIQLFAACQKAPSVRRVIVKSTSEVYGSSAFDPVLFTEVGTAAAPRRGLRARQHRHRGLCTRSGPAQARHRGHHPAAGQHDRPGDGHRAVAVSGGPGGAVRPRPRRPAATAARAGRARRAGTSDDGGRAGTFNVGASGIIMMSQAIRRAGRVALPVPRFALSAVDSLRRATRYTELDREQLNYLSYGRVMDTTRMRNDLGYSPKWTTAEAFDDYVRGRGLTPIVDPRWVRSMESRAVSAAQRWGR